MAIDIKDVLNLFHENNCFFTYNNYDNKEFLILNIQDWNCQLYLTSPHPKGINFSLRYYVDANGQNTVNHPTYYTEDIKDIFPILNKIIGTQQNTNYLSRFQRDNEGLMKYNSIVEVLKKALAEEECPREFQYNISKDQYEETHIEIVEHNSEVKYSLNLGQLKHLSQNKDKIKSIMGVVELNFYSELISQPDDGHINSYSLFIPGYELHKYPLLKSQDRIEDQAKYIHHNFENWIKDLIEFPNMANKELQNRLQYAILEDEVPHKNSNMKNTKRKL